jgi:hypothetical protein
MYTLRRQNIRRLHRTPSLRRIMHLRRRLRQRRTLHLHRILHLRPKSRGQRRTKAQD